MKYWPTTNENPENQHLVPSKAAAEKQYLVPSTAADENVYDEPNSAKSNTVKPAVGTAADDLYSPFADSVFSVEKRCVAFFDLSFLSPVHSFEDSMPSKTAGVSSVRASVCPTWF